MREIAADLEPLDARIVVKSEEGGPVAGVEWLLPTGVVIFIAGKYFGAMLSEAGKVHYPQVADAITRALRRLRRSPVTSIASTPGKLSEDPPGAISVYFVVERGTVAKYVFDPEFEDVEIGQLLGSLEELAKLPLPEQRSAVAQGGWRTVFRFDKESGLWRRWDARAERFLE